MNSKKQFDPLLIDLKEFVLGNMNSHSPKWGGVLRYQERLCVPNVDDLRNRIHEEARGSF